MEPDPLGQPAHGQGDARAGDRLPLPVPAAGRMRRALPGLALAGAGVAVSLGAHCGASGAAPARALRRPRDRRRQRPARSRRGRARPHASPPGRCSGSASSCSGLDLVFPDILALGLKALARRRRGRRDHVLRDALGGPEARHLRRPLAARRHGVLDLRRVGDRGRRRRDRGRRGRGRVRGRARHALRHARDRHPAAAAQPLGLDDEQFGAWVGASVHDVAQVVATSSTAGAVALATAVVVKLTRVMLLAPLIAGIAVQRGRGGDPRSPTRILAAAARAAVHRRLRRDDRRREPRHRPRSCSRADRRPPHGAARHGALRARNPRQPRSAQADRPRPLALGLASWVLIAVVSYAGVRSRGPSAASHNVGQESIVVRRRTPAVNMEWGVPQRLFPVERCGTPH